jgi:hypothetical protein
MLNKLIFIGQINHLDVFQPSISHDSFFDHRQFTHKAGYQTKKEDWVEIMFPMYREKLFKAAGPYFNETITGQGIDLYMMPVLQVIHNMKNTAVVHAIQIKHCRPVQSGDRTYSDGKSNFDNINHLRDLSIELINKHKGLFDETFMKRIIDVRYYRGISIFKKLKRVPGMLKNMYKEIVDKDFTWNNFSIEEQRQILASERSNNFLDTSRLESLYKVKGIKESVRDVLYKMKEVHEKREI